MLQILRSLFPSALFFVMVCCFSNPAMAKRIDLRKQSQSKTTYEVGFCARPSAQNKPPGHAYILFQMTPPKGKSSLLAIGNTPRTKKNEVQAMTGQEVAGFLSKERLSNTNRQCLFVRLNKKQYQRVMYATTIPSLKKLGLITKPNDVIYSRYQLLKNDCITMLQHVAKVLQKDGLKVPKRQRWNLPMAYIKALIKAN